MLQHCGGYATSLYNYASYVHVSRIKIVSVSIIIIALTVVWRLVLAPVARRISTTTWWPSKLAAHSGVSPVYTECVLVLQRR